MGQGEIDIVAVEPGGGGRPGVLVFVEVRSRRSDRFGTPEESLDRRKLMRLWRAAMGLRRLGVLPDGEPLPRLATRVDLIAVDLAPSLGQGIGGPGIRHVRGLDGA